MWETNLEKRVGEDANFDIDYVFTSLSFKENDSDPDQNQYVAIDENGVLSLTNPYASVGMKPLVKVEAKYGENILATAYITIEVIKQAAVDKITVNSAMQNFNYRDLTSAGNDNTVDLFTYDEINAQVYGVLGITAADFASYYNTTPTIAGKGNNLTVGVVSNNAGGAWTLPDNTLEGGFMKFRINNKTAFGEGSLTVTYEATNANYPAIEFVINYNVVNDYDLAANLPAKSEWFINGEYIISGQLVTTAAQSPVNEYAMSGQVFNVYKSFGDWYTTATGDAEQTANIVADDGIKFVIVNEDGSYTAAAADNTAITGDNASEQTMTLYGGSAAWTKEVTYPVKLVATVVNGETIDLDAFTVRFVTPFVMKDFDVTVPSSGSEAVTSDLKEQINITTAYGEVEDIYKSGSATRAASTRFALSDGDFSFNFEITEGNTNNFSVNATTGILTFDPQGSPIPVDMTAKLKVTVTIGSIVVQTSTINVTVTK